MSSREGFAELLRAGSALALLGLAGIAIWEGVADSALIAGALLVIAVAISAAVPAAGVMSVLMAAPTMFELHTLPWGSFSLLELATLSLIAGVGIRLGMSALKNDWKAFHPLFAPAQIVIPVGMLLLATGISLLTLADPGHRDASLREVRTVILEPLLFFAALRIVTRDALSRSLAGGALIVTGAATAAYGIAQTLFDFGGVAAGSVMRATGPYPHPNNLAFLLERTLLFTLAVAVLRPRWWLVWGLVVLQAAGVAATYSRGAFLAIAFGFAVLLMIKGLYRWLLGLGILGVVAAAVAFTVAPDRLIDAGGSGSEPTRFTIWRASIRMGLDHPVFGVGPDQFLYQYWRRYVEPMGWPERYTSHPHNLVLDVWLRMGVVGLAAFGTLVIGLIWWIRRAFGVVRDDIWAIGAIAALVGGLAHGMVDNGFFLPDLATVTWFFVAMVISARQKRSESEASSQ